MNECNFSMLESNWFFQTIAKITLLPKQTSTHQIFNQNVMEIIKKFINPFLEFCRGLTKFPPCNVAIHRKSLFYVMLKGNERITCDDVKRPFPKIFVQTNASPFNPFYILREGGNRIIFLVYIFIQSVCCLLYVQLFIFLLDQDIRII